MVQKLNIGSNQAASARVQRRNEERRVAILRAASNVFRERGFAATGMREIAAEADLSPGNLYHYFSGKHEILYFCQDRALARMLGALDEMREHEGTATDRIRHVIRAHVRCVLDELGGATAHLEVEALPDELRGDIIEKRDRYEHGLRELVAGGVRAGELAPCDEALVTRAMLGAINWSARWYKPGGRQSAEEVADGMADYLVRGLQGQAAADSRLASGGMT
jgi:AcrR family transcriptional regulator